MSAYFVKGKGWKYYFTLNNQCCTRTWFKAERKAKEAENLREKEGRLPNRWRKSFISFSIAAAGRKTLPSHRCSGTDTVPT